MESDNPIWRECYNHPIPWDTVFEPLSLPDMLAAQALEQPMAPLIDFMGRKYSYADVLSGARRVAKGLAELGIERGDRVGLFLPNVPHYVAAYYGAMMVGAIVVNFSPLYTVEELKYQAEDSGTKLLFTLSVKALLPRALEVMDQSCIEHLVVGSVAGALPTGKSLLYRFFKAEDEADLPDDPRVSRFSRLISNDGELLPASIDPLRDVALLQYTGGTTGTPKGAMLTHQNLTANARQIAIIDPHRGDDDRIIGVLPLFHVFANTCVLNRTVASGGEMVLLPRFDAEQVMHAIERTRATYMPGVPTMYQALLDHPVLHSTNFSSLRVCISGGAPLPREVKQRFEAATGAVIAEGYGLTESSGVVSANPYEGQNKTGSIGQPVPGTRIKLLNREDPTKNAAMGEPGELAFAGPQVMKGYWRRPEADAEVFVGGYLRTGDVATIDSEGYIRIVDRIKDMITVGGFKVFPSQVEQVLYRHPAVKEALVIGIPDAYRGESPKAFVALNEGMEAEADDLRKWLNPQLGKHEQVVALEIRGSLPKTLVGKLSRKELVAEERDKYEAMKDGNG
ncbi:MAG: long-chain fatty acid--CoA ligase [Sphingobium sp.]|nr:long-chain fatty acid--CoA ligase [Sphingobium sp.]MBP6111763.1 long-chain fatty acid--CoA ligase [Sphingobium sp.]MBP8672442.1 long-chain fatty acid--CoA ligase [Sphingobium sp.]MBP9156330.1 long-chain fatty acid--CoA ligase [Sphingobium sp.]